MDWDWRCAVPPVPQTRTGGTVKLAELISSAQERAAVLAGEKDAKRPEGDRFSDAELKDIGNKVGVGAVKYADLSKNRDKDYIDFGSMLQFDTVPYLMYAYTRAQSVARGAAAAATAESDGAIPVAPVNLAQPVEHTLGLTLLMFPDELLAVLATSQPHHLCTYLYRLSQAYTKFFTHLLGTLGRLQSDPGLYALTGICTPQLALILGRGESLESDPGLRQEYVKEYKFSSWERTERMITFSYDHVSTPTNIKR
ncbi:hypothetical protein HKX48_002924 [Thoreauomyces humboldtii]|nr:hypothetical protein HKX48_002924 [Thoreauomyces humboldtii]